MSINQKKFLNQEAFLSRQRIFNHMGFLVKKIEFILCSFVFIFCHFGILVKTKWQNFSFEGKKRDKGPLKPYHQTAAEKISRFF